DGDGADPGAERLRADVGLARSTQIVVEPRRVDLLDALGRAVAEQPLARQFLAAQQNPGEPPIADGDLRLPAGLGLEAEREPLAFDLGVPALQRGEADR